MNTSIEREKKPAQDGTRGLTFWFAVAAIIAFDILLLVWPLAQLAGPRVSQIVSKAGGIVGPLLVLPLCYMGFREASRMGDCAGHLPDRRRRDRSQGVDARGHARR